MKTNNHFFSFHEYFTSQAQALALSKTKMEKRIEKSGKTEEQVIIQPDWSKELKIFMDADLNKKAWEGLYRVDTLKDDAQMAVRYLALDSSLQVKNAVVVMTGEQVSSIDIKGRFRNFYYESAWNLFYKPDSGYHISGDQSILFGEKNSFEIETQFLK